jgi:ABC-type dipeptide/oligopeptide/nickel transport system ATPase subunit
MGAASRVNAEPVVLRVEEVSHAYGSGSRARTVLRDISCELAAGRTLAVVGESGAGKSTLSRLIAGLERPAAGRILVDGEPARIRTGRVSPVQMVFQDPAEALNRFISVGASIAEPLRNLRRDARRSRVAELMQQVGIDAARAGERPSRFSGGQLQRLVLARALAGDPKLLLCDEPTSALDVSVQAQIVNLLLELQTARGFAVVLVTHDLGVARVLADEIMVLRAGTPIELSSADRFFAGPEADYSRRLLRDTAEQMLHPARERTPPPPPIGGSSPFPSSGGCRST